jgi:hypothetical protein
MLLMPLILSRLAGFITYSVLTLFVLGPFVAFAIRSRRRLADATAVQLTRNPDGLARALIRLTTLGHPIRGVGWAEMLFIVGSEANDQRKVERMRERVTEIRAAPAADFASRTDAALTMVRELKQSEVEEGEPEKHGFIYRFHPSLINGSPNSSGWAPMSWNGRTDHSDLIDAMFVGVFLLIVALIVSGEPLTGLG